MMVIGIQPWVHDVLDLGDQAPEEAREALSTALHAHFLELAGRDRLVKWAGLTCNCSWQFTRGEFPQAECPVHSVVMLDVNGNWH
jgi:hypothetical protein